MDLNDDSLILNITVPQSKPSSSVKQSPSGGKISNRAQKNKERKEKAKKERAIEKNTLKKITQRSPSEKKHNGMQRGSKKIQKPANKKKGAKKAVEEVVEPKNVETLLDIDEKKDEDTDLFIGDSFRDVPGLNERLVYTLETHGFTTMTKIQKESIPILLKHKSCLIKSETGSGKTLAYLVITQNESKLIC
jgi:Superfamily II DNA and RNA helicases